MTHRSHDNGRIALFPGTFDPFTTGHASIVERGLEIFDRIVIVIGVNAGKHDGSPEDLRLETIRQIYRDNDRIDVMTWQGLTIDAARRCGAGFLLRGVRSVKDFEYERDMADANRMLGGIETVLLFSLPELACVSSSLVRELKKHGHDISEFLPTKQS